jgi:hypothetical protein
MKSFQQNWLEAIVQLVEQLNNDPKFEGSNAVTASIVIIYWKKFQQYWLASIAQLIEQATQDRKFEDSFPATADTVTT